MSVMSIGYQGLRTRVLPWSPYVVLSVAATNMGYNDHVNRSGDESIGVLKWYCRVLLIPKEAVHLTSASFLSKIFFRNVVRGARWWVGGGCYSCSGHPGVPNLSGDLFPFEVHVLRSVCEIQFGTLRLSSKCQVTSI